MGFDVAVIHGRDPELARIGELLEQARGRRSASLVVIGEPGAGKSSLLAEARRRARGMTVLEAQGLEAEATLPFAGLHQLLRPVLGMLDRIPEA
jgi:predicted ATPase